MDKISLPKNIINAIIFHVTGIDRVRLLLDDYQITENQAEQIEALMKRAELGEPLQYVLGKCGFYKNEFAVNPGVLIPRPETEMIIEYIVNRYNADDILTIMDIGTGSGCIAISLALELPKAKIYALDISDAALCIARDNAKKYNVNIEFMKYDICQLHENELNYGNTLKMQLPPVDVIVSNPPYIKCGDIPMLDANVRDYEPHIALNGGYDGLDFYRCIARNVCLNLGGIIVLEVGAGQAGDVCGILQNSGRFDEVSAYEDYSGIMRMVVSTAR